MGDHLLVLDLRSLGMVPKQQKKKKKRAWYRLLLGIAGSKWLTSVNRRRVKQISFQARHCEVPVR